MTVGRRTQYRIARQETERFTIASAIGFLILFYGKARYDSHDPHWLCSWRFDLFHIGHLNLLRRAKDHCNFLSVGVVADEVLIRHKGVTPVIPLAERLEIVRSLRFVDMAIPVTTNDKIEIWKDLHFNVLFKGSDWRDTEKGSQLEREFVPLGVDVLFLPYTFATSSSALRRTLRNIDDLASGSSEHTLVVDVSGRDGAESERAPKLSSHT